MDGRHLRRNYGKTRRTFPQCTRCPDATHVLKCSEGLPYLDKIRSSIKAFPSLRHLASWMEVSSAETRYIHLSQRLPERMERLHRVRVCQVDLRKGAIPTQTHFTDSVSLSEALAAGGRPSDKFDARIYVAEDLSTSVIESFGSAFDVDPFFWKAHIDDYLWSTVASESADIKSLDLVTRKRSYLNLQYLRPRYYGSTTSFENATRQAGNFNVLRQLDSDRSRASIQDGNGAAAALMRAKASLWIRPNKRTEEGVLGNVYRPQR